jgi:DNA-binding IclR family transcriptional regulator
VPVKRSQSATRVLAILEMIARHQPIGVSELARLLEADKSAAQRGVMTLADEGWIHATPGPPTRWQLTGHIHVVAHLAHSRSDLRQRARGPLEALRNETGESIALTTPDVGRFVVIEVLESHQMLRTAPHIGMIVSVADSATGLAMLPYMSRERQIELLGRKPNKTELDAFAATLDQGYSISLSDIVTGSVNIAAPIFAVDGVPIAAVVLSAPRERLAGEDRARVGQMVAQTARSLSRGAPSTASVHRTL